MFIVINRLAHQPCSVVWHPTCNRNDSAAVTRRPDFQAKRSVNAGRFSETAGFLYRFGDAIKFHARPRRAGVAQTKLILRLRPKLGGSHL
jgi:hypothetical protein